MSRTLLLTLLVLGIVSAAFAPAADNAPAGHVFGWRMDGTGRFPDATPPVQWSEEDNVAWKTPLPGRGFASPIVVGQRVFVLSEPAELLAIDATNGTVLWRHSNTMYEVFDKAKADRVTAEFEAIRSKHEQLRRAARKAPTPEARKEIDAQAKQLDQTLREMEWNYPITNRRAGKAACTPLSDGQRVYAAFGTGIVAAFSPDGKRLWTRFVEGSKLGWGHTGSPVLADGKLIVHYQDLIALNPATGEEIWRAELQPRYATPLVAKIGETDVLITPCGAVISAKTGRRIASAGINCSECSPVIHEGVLFAHSRGKVTALYLPAAVNEGNNGGNAADQAPKLRQLWEATASRGRRTPSAAYHDGLIYGVNTEGILGVFDAATGKVVYRKRLNLRRVYSSATVAGDHLYISGTDGTTVVIRPGRKYEEIARNRLEGIGTCPVFVGKRMYVRTNNHLYCIEG